MHPASRTAIACAVVAALFAASLVHADEPPPPPPAPAPADGNPDEPRPAPPVVPPPAPTPAPAAPPAPAQGNALDFDLFGDAKKPTAPGVNLSTGPTAPVRDPAEVARQVHRRRRMLQLHQGFGFATLALLAATCVIGQLNYIDKYGGGDFTEKYQNPHLGLAMASTATFATTGLLGLTAPTPYKKPIKADAALLHKVMMGLATAGMVTQLALGFATAHKGGELYQRDLALTHLVVGYATFASMLTGYLAFVF